MELELEIKQKSFKSPSHKAGVNIIYTSNWLNEKMAGVFKSHGISSQQYNILRILRGQYPTPISVKDIRERMLDKMSDVSRLIDRMLVKGLVIRKECPQDRRNVDIIITAKGIDLLASMDPEMDYNASAFGNLTEEEVNHLNFLLDKLRG